MLTAAQRMRLTVVLVGARNPGNIGAAARAMQDFGFSDLRVVNPFAPPFEAAQLAASETSAAMAPQDCSTDWRQSAIPQLLPAAMTPDHSPAAVGAGAVMRAARRFDALSEAIADCTGVVGTTAIGARELRQPVLSLAEAAPALLRGLASLAAESSSSEPRPDRRIALLFGSEKTGLTNDQLSHCTALLTIPLFAPEGERHLSMNLGQAVAVCLYELTRSGFESARHLPIQHQAATTAADRERLTQLLLEAMQQTGYARRFPAHTREHVVRQLATSLGTHHDEAITWMGFLKQVLQAVPSKNHG